MAAWEDRSSSSQIVSFTFVLGRDFDRAADSGDWDDFADRASGFAGDGGRCERRIRGSGRYRRVNLGSRVRSFALSRWGGFYLRKVRRCGTRPCLWRGRRLGGRWVRRSGG